MSDYIHYTDLSAIAVGDLAWEIGDFGCALQNYTKALDRLRKYPGDRMQPMMMASNLSAKIATLSKLPRHGNPILRFETWQLTKSSFVKASQCTKQLYLEKHKKHEKTPFSEKTKHLFKLGHTFEDDFRNTKFPDGLNIKDKVGNFAYFNSYTKHALNRPDKTTLYEATIIEDDVLVMCDILVKDHKGLIDVYEIKLHKAINEAILNDVAIQYYVCKKRFGNNLRSFNLVLGGDDNNGVVTNVTKDLEPKVEDIRNKIAEYNEVLSNKEPVIAMGPQCYTPYECQFIDYCTKMGKERLKGDRT